MYRTITNNEIITDGRENKNLPRLPINIPSDEIEIRKYNFRSIKPSFNSNMTISLSFNHKKYKRSFSYKSYIQIRELLDFASSYRDK